MSGGVFTAVPTAQKEDIKKYTKKGEQRFHIHAETYGHVQLESFIDHAVVPAGYIASPACACVVLQLLVFVFHLYCPTGMDHVSG